MAAGRGARVKKLRFTHIRLENWRNFRQAEADLGQRVFLIGPNASGKSNFLDAFRFLRDIVTEGGLQKAVQKRAGGFSALRCLAARQPSDVGIKVSIGSHDQPGAWEYELTFNEKGKRVLVTRERVSEVGRDLFVRPDAEDENDPERLTQTYLEQVNMNRDFRDIPEFLRSVRYLHIVPQLIREPDRSVGRQNDPFGGDFLEQVAQVPERMRTARLKMICEALKAVVPQLQELQFWTEQRGRGIPHLRGKYEHWRPKGAWQTEEQFSDGTLRLIGLLWAVLDGSGPLLLEEPELSLHPEVVRHIPSMIYRVQKRTGRQVILSTHAFDLLRGRGIGLDEVLLLIPDREGTTIHSPASLDEVRRLVEAGLDLADAVQPVTRPKDVAQLSLFGDRQ